MRPLIVLLSACLLLTQGLAEAAVYKVIGKDGKVIYTDEPPADGTNARELRVQSYSGPAQQGKLSAQEDWQAILKRPAASNSAPPPVVMYSTDWCGYCKQARQYMRAKNIAFSDRDVEKDKSAQAQYAKLGGRGVPYFVIGRLTLAGFSQDSFDATLRDAQK
ncbi:glutaredoxin domain-containing protein [Uliginosibacterium sp. H3]|uniref:Glutaredoxin domain-containing protein n=1 Tax=Uliginosibacterium silvisoli TaxID=3114758 RepID=A0ABU6K3V5_9RHOO|nr:glutaredoxin domain-containing protein [Uliginosibacterium sp. H3]